MLNLNGRVNLLFIRKSKIRYIFLFTCLLGALESTMDTMDKVIPAIDEKVQDTEGIVGDTLKVQSVQYSQEDWD